VPMFKGLFAAPNPTCVKFVLAKLGICGESLRLPLVPLSAAQREAMDKLAAQYKLDKALTANR
jgi:4-hydroxy-tetrahydrodipicolinate synthase